MRERERKGGAASEGAGDGASERERDKERERERERGRERGRERETERESDLRVSWRGKAAYGSRRAAQSSYVKRDLNYIKRSP